MSLRIDVIHPISLQALEGSDLEPGAPIDPKVLPLSRQCPKDRAAGISGVLLDHRACLR